MQSRVDNAEAHENSKVLKKHVHFSSEYHYNDAITIKNKHVFSILLFSNTSALLTFLCVHHNDAIWFFNRFAILK